MKRFILTSTMLMPLLSFGQTAAADSCGTTLSLGQGRTLLGTMVGDPGTDGGKTNNQSFTAAMGQPATLIDTYVDDAVTPDKWADSANYSAAGIAQLGDPSKIIPVVGIPMAIVGHNGDEDFRAIARGDWDTAILNTFQIYVDHGFRAFYIRLGWEMDGDWYPWSVNPSNAADFVAAFQRIATLARSYKQALIAIMWNPGYVPNAAASFMSYFPGAQYVDSIGIDTYGAASGVPDTAPFASPDPHAYTLQDAIGLAKATGKPLSLPETGGGPGDTAFPENLAKVITASGVKVDAMIVWDDYYGLATSGHWSDDPAASAAWKKAFADIAASSAAASGISQAANCVEATAAQVGATATNVSWSGGAGPSPADVPVAPTVAAPPATVAAAVASADQEAQNVEAQIKALQTQVDALTAAQKGMGMCDIPGLQAVGSSTPNPTAAQ
jgi:hypothetical protein